MTIRVARAVQGMFVVLGVIVAAANSPAVAQPAPTNPPAQPDGTQPAPPPAAQQPGSNSAIPIHPIVGGVAGVQNTTAPEWIVPGMRLAYIGSIGTTNDAAGATKMVEDPNGTITDSSGKTYRMGSQVGTSTGNSWYHLIDVIAVEPGIIVLANSGYTMPVNAQSGGSSTLTSQAVVSHPSGCDFFLHPSLLEQIPEPSFNGMGVMRYVMDLSGAKYNCAHFILSAAADNRISTAYDLSSGAMLTYTALSRSTSQAHEQAPGGQFTPTTNTTHNLTLMTFMGARAVEIPWKNQSMPQWARTAKKMRYQGTIKYAGPAYVNIPDWVVQISAEFTTRKVGETYTMHDMVTTQQAPYSEAQTAPAALSVTGPASIGGLWMDPAALAQLSQQRQGTIFDSDPTTGVQIGLEFAGQGQNGQPIVVIARGNQVFKAVYVYDARDGRLLGTSKTDYDPLTGNSQTMELNLTAAE